MNCVLCRQTKEIMPRKTMAAALVELVCIIPVVASSTYGFIMREVRSYRVT